LGQSGFGVILMTFDARMPIAPRGYSLCCMNMQMAE
jgi:hypothetical protein